MSGNSCSLWFASLVLTIANFLGTGFSALAVEPPSDEELAAEVDRVLNERLFLNPERAHSILDSVLTFLDDSDSSKAKGRAFILKSYLFFQRGDLTNAVKYALMTKKIADVTKDFNVYRSYHNVMGLIHTYQEDYKNAIISFRKALDYAKTGEIPTLRAVVTMANLGQVLAFNGQLEEALVLANEGYEMASNEGLEWGMSICMVTLADIARIKDENNKALEYYLNALQQGGADLGEVTIEIYIRLAQTYLNMDEFEEALNWGRQAINLTSTTKSVRWEKMSCEVLYHIHRTLGNNDSALYYNERYIEALEALNAQKLSLLLGKIEFREQVVTDSLNAIVEQREITEGYQREVRKHRRNMNMAFISAGFILILAAGLYNRNRFIRRSKTILEMEKNRSENLLLNILPNEVAEELKEKGESEARDFENVTVLFTDFVEFTQTAEKLSAKELVNEINTCFKAFDEISHKYQIEKIKTIGDAYMAAGGLHIPRTSEPKDVVKAALEMQEFIEERHKTREAGGEPAFQMRVGIHTGPVVAGIVGVKKFQYDIWGDTVNTAARMESHGKIGQVNISEATYELMKDDPEYNFVRRETLHVKGKGEMTMYFVDRTK